MALDLFCYSACDSELVESHLHFTKRTGLPILKREQAPYKSLLILRLDKFQFDSSRTEARELIEALCAMPGSRVKVLFENETVLFDSDSDLVFSHPFWGGHSESWGG